MSKREKSALAYWNKLLRGYKLCKGCGCPMLKKGQKRKHPDDYRHAQGCPNDKPRKRKTK